jgi:hypothetical protein
MIHISPLNKLIVKSTDWISNQRGIFIALLFTSTFFSLSAASIFFLMHEVAGVYISIGAGFAIITTILVMFYQLTRWNPNNFNGPKDFISTGRKAQKRDEEYFDMLKQNRELEKKNPTDYKKIIVLEKEIDGLVLNNFTSYRFKFIIKDNNEPKVLIELFYHDIIRRLSMFSMENKIAMNNSKNFNDDCKYFSNGSNIIMARRKKHGYNHIEQLSDLKLMKQATNSKTFVAMLDNISAN